MYILTETLKKNKNYAIFIFDNDIWKIKKEKLKNTVQIKSNQSGLDDVDRTLMWKVLLIVPHYPAYNYFHTQRQNIIKKQANKYNDGQQQPLLMVVYCCLWASAVQW